MENLLIIAQTVSVPGVDIVHDLRQGDKRYGRAPVCNAVIAKGLHDAHAPGMIRVLVGEGEVSDFRNALPVTGHADVLRRVDEHFDVVDVQARPQPLIAPLRRRAS